MLIIYKNLESIAFLLGILTKMPAVQAFSIYASVAIFFDFILQLTCFCAIMVLDGKRVKVLKKKYIYIY